ncbi:uncharacterized protein LOC106175645 [Lingula anatina]|uniref:Uncharacterized protein LOC106175645 n=1 Tax=Lingula anatina TaxID=7574 RepID=A0A1S3JS53_LINAN|nr:uncharacterized protein LOC106175645 [Lingula anatina]|eukprot:XP_013413205.1 uncharacterized protein LOC106175645 [Lingula anatina]
MAAERNQKLRSANRAQLTKLFQRASSLMSDEPSVENVETLDLTYELIEEKMDYLKTLDERILSKLSDEKMEDGIAEADEFMFSAKEKLRRIRKHKENIQSEERRSEPSISNAPTPSDDPPRSNMKLNYRLPKLILSRFDGNLLQWPAFNDDFVSAIADNEMLSTIEKFQFLRAQLDGEAFSTIAGLQLTANNYENAKELLRERYGQTHKIINAFMRALWELPRPDEEIKSLRFFYDRIETFIRGLSSLGKEEQSYGELLIPMILDKLPANTRRQIARAHGNNEWSIADLHSTLKSEIHALQAGEIDGFNQEKSYRPTAAFFTNSTTKKTTNKPKRKLKCAFCKNEHSSITCPVVSEQEKRFEIAKREYLCFNCLTPNHTSQKCLSKFHCRSCNGKHHTALHAKQKSEASAAQKAREPPAVEHAASTFTQGAKNQRNVVLLKTAIVEVSNKQTPFQLSATSGVLFDEGATRSFITEELVHKLQLQPTHSEEINLSVFGMDCKQPQTFDIVTISLKTTSKEFVDINAVVVPEISAPLHNLVTRRTANLSHLRNLRLAHTPSDDRSPFFVSVLIGADHYWDFVEDTIMRGPGPTAVASKFGYLLSGPAHSDDYVTANDTAFHVMAKQRNAEDDTLDKFWNLESIGIKDNKQTVQDPSDFQNFQRNYIEKRDDQYVAKLPWKTDHSPLPTNYRNACHRTRNTVRKLPVETRRVYDTIIRNQEKRNFIEKVGDDDTSSGHYLPHRPVKKDSITTPIRIVYDCSAKATPDDPSLNDCLFKGPQLLNDLVGIFLRFRIHNVAITSDIEKAFLNIGLHEDDRDFTKFLWLEDPEDTESKFEVYRFTSVLFGSISSPAILNSVVRLHLDMSENGTAKALKRDVYVDNIVTGTDTSNQAIQMYEESNDLLASAGFSLQSWATNDPKLRNIVETDGVAHADHKNTPMLGMIWDTEQDTLSFKSGEEIPVSQVTKREVISRISRVYDPLGLLAPVIVRGKMFMQELWKAELDWDQTLPPELSETWKEIAADLEQCSLLKVTRQYFSNTKESQQPMELHCFVDASEKAYGCAVYLRNGEQTTLVMSKSRVAPVKTITILRLELMAAVLGTRLTSFVHDQLKENIHIAKCVLWTDSQIVLCWIKSDKHLPLFVRNRVNEIKPSLFNEYRYCPTDDNPADLITRGTTVLSLEIATIWWEGPAWLTQGDWPIGEYNSTVMHLRTERVEFAPLTPSDSLNEQLFKNNPNVIDPTTAVQGHSVETDISDKANNQRMRGNQPLTTKTDISEVVDIGRHGTLPKLLNVTALVLRFVAVMKGKIHKTSSYVITNASPSAEEIVNAEEIWIRRAPWFGGFWERLIGLTKNAMRKTLGRARITLDELHTITSEIEATLNDRPAYVNEGEPLTPSMLLNGRRINTLPCPLTDEDEGLDPQMAKSPKNA